MNMLDFRALDESGYIHLPGVIPENMLRKFEAELRQLGELGLSRRGIQAKSNDAMTDLLRAGGDFRVSLFSNLKNLRIVQQMTHSCGQRLDREAFWDWANLSVPVFYPSLRADVPEEEKYLLPMHQDYATQCSRAWRMWVPLRPANRKGGTMCLVPGSHKGGMIDHDTTDPSRPFVPSEHIQGLPVVELDLPAGDAILLDPLLVHGSVPAQDDLMKYVLLVQIQDLTTLSDPEDPEDPLALRLAMAKKRDLARG